MRYTEHFGGTEKSSTVQRISQKMEFAGILPNSVSRDSWPRGGSIGRTGITRLDKRQLGLADAKRFLALCDLRSLG